MPWRRSRRASPPPSADPPLRCTRGGYGGAMPPIVVIRLTSKLPVTRTGRSGSHSPSHRHFFGPSPSRAVGPISTALPGIPRRLMSNLSWPGTTTTRSRTWSLTRLRDHSERSLDRSERSLVGRTVVCLVDVAVTSRVQVVRHRECRWLVMSAGAFARFDRGVRGGIVTQRSRAVLHQGRDRPGRERHLGRWAVDAAGQDGRLVLDLLLRGRRGSLGAPRPDADLAVLQLHRLVPSFLIAQWNYGH